MNVGNKAHSYVSIFLRESTITLHMEALQSVTIELGTRSTPQGALLSPFRFNVNVRDLSNRLQAIAHIKHAVYAVDITVCTCTGSEGEIAESLQMAVDNIHEHTAGWKRLNLLAETVRAAHHSE